MTSPLEHLLAEVAAAPSLPDARCRGRHEIFDWDPRADRDDAEFAERAALKLCATCPALASCGVWFDALPALRRPLGIVAGRVNKPPSRGRPRRAEAT